MTHLALMIVVNLHTTVGWLANILRDPPADLTGYINVLCFIGFWGWLHYESYAFWQHQPYHDRLVGFGLVSFGSLWGLIAIGALLDRDPVLALVLGGIAITAIVLACVHLKGRM